MSEQETVSVEGPGGLKASATGTQTTHILLALAVCAWVWYGNFTQDSRAAEREVQRAAAMDRMAEAIVKQTKTVEQLERTTRAQAYILTLPQKERERLNLVRPDVLYEMQGYPRER